MLALCVNKPIKDNEILFLKYLADRFLFLFLFFAWRVNTHISIKNGAENCYFVVRNVSDVIL